MVGYMRAQARALMLGGSFYAPIMTKTADAGNIAKIRYGVRLAVLRIWQRKFANG
jgi:hypothetical protein